MKINYKKSLKFVTLLISALLIGTVSAVAYVTLQWQTSGTVVANPQVCFVLWSDNTKQNSFTYSISIFPAVLTIDENITYGVWNWHSTESRTVYFRLASENTNETDVDWIYYKVYRATTLYERNETNLDSPSTAWSTGVSATNNTKYSIRMEIKGGSSAVAGHTPTFTFQIKVENP